MTRKLKRIIYRHRNNEEKKNDALKDATKTGRSIVYHLMDSECMKFSSNPNSISFQARGVFVLFSRSYARQYHIWLENLFIARDYLGRFSWTRSFISRFQLSWRNCATLKRIDRHFCLLSIRAVDFFSIYQTVPKRRNVHTHKYFNTTKPVKLLLYYNPDAIRFVGS